VVGDPDALSGCDRAGVAGFAGMAVAAWAAVDAGLGGTAKKRVTQLLAPTLY
jgi:hypothetical protein